MKKFVFVILFVLILTGLFLIKTQAEAYSSASVYIDEIAPVNILEGEIVRGSIKVEVVCAWPDDDVEAQASINFDDGNKEDLGKCHCETDSSQIKRVVCEFDFSHRYDTADTYFVIPHASWGGGGGFAALPNLVTGHIETVVVAEPPSPAAATTTGNPLLSTTTAAVIRSITNFIFYIVSGLAVLLIIIGGITILTAAGSPNQIMRGRKIIVFTLVGYAVMAIARGFLALIYRILEVNITT